MTKRTKIVCTLGPASESQETITKMLEAGMNVVRLNFSHGTHENHLLLMQHVRSVSEELGIPTAILQDLQGPKIRVGTLPENGIPFTPGEMVSFDTSLERYAEGIVPVDYKDFHMLVSEGERMLLDDGKMETTIRHIIGTRIDAEVIVGGTLTSHKGINIPDSELHISALTEKDKADAKFGVEYDVDMVALSFVTSAKDILDLRYLIKEYEKELGKTPDQPIHIIAKIERKEAVDNIEEILDVADGIMIARGDLGIEMPAEDVPLIQKRLIDLALKKAKPVIVATQMLDSMQHNPRPTRAEVSDVANAVIDHADAVMLSNETATGEYPVDTVKMMTTIIEETESSAYDDLHMHDDIRGGSPVDEVMTGLARVLAEEVGAHMILAASLSGDTARLISRHRPELPIVVATSTARVERQMNLSWGVVPFILQPCRSIEELVERSILRMKEQKLTKKGQKIIVVAGEPVGHAGHVNLLEVREVK
ncbi:MAG: pyruvate kinase [Candidatus Magasanikbacteria bacterium CG1_02_41_34]|nr:MAG: pyruvate kinase [Candidatus Magasanikbacteria bacterium CG1_02_41_34]